MARVTDAECVAFLQWALPRLRMRWAGLRRVRRQVRRRIARRIDGLGLADVRAYRAHLAGHSEEWATLDAMCRIPVSRFLRDRVVFLRLLDGLEGTVRCWSAGCASGEEPYSLAILARERHPGLRLQVVATDVDEGMLERARTGAYRGSSLRELPADWIARAFEPEGGQFRLRPAYRRGIEFARQDIREQMPDGPFDLVLCRNLVFTYFDGALQREMLGKLRARLAPGGRLVIGARESLPAEAEGVSSC